MSANVHELRCWPKYFKPLSGGIKNFEIRYDDRGFKEGDVLRVREWDPDKGYTGVECERHVMYILRKEMGLEKGYVVLALAPVEARLS